MIDHNFYSGIWVLNVHGLGYLWLYNLNKISKVKNVFFSKSVSRKNICIQPCKKAGFFFWNSHISKSSNDPPGMGLENIHLHLFKFWLNCRIPSQPFASHYFQVSMIWVKNVAKNLQTGLDLTTAALDVQLPWSGAFHDTPPLICISFAYMTKFFLFLFVERICKLVAGYSRIAPLFLLLMLDASKLAEVKSRIVYELREWCKIIIVRYYVRVSLPTVCYALKEDSTVAKGGIGWSSTFFKITDPSNHRKASSKFEKFTFFSLHFLQLVILGIQA